MFTLLQMAKRDKSGAADGLAPCHSTKNSAHTPREFSPGGAGCVEPNPAWAGMLLDSLIEIFLSHRAGAPTLVDP
jgi:hypothetical protein